MNNKTSKLKFYLDSALLSATDQTLKQRIQYLTHLIQLFPDFFDIYLKGTNSISGLETYILRKDLKCLS